MTDNANKWRVTARVPSAAYAKRCEWCDTPLTVRYPYGRPPSKCPACLNECKRQQDREKSRRCYDRKRRRNRKELIDAIENQSEADRQDEVESAEAEAEAYLGYVHDSRSDSEDEA